MSYFVRAFCKADTKPTVKQILDHINGLDLGFIASTNLNPEELESNQWTDFELRYKIGKLPLLVECNKITDENGLAKDEIHEFIDEIGTPGIFAIKKKKVIRHLQETNYIIANQLPTSDIDDDGFNANGEFLKYFVDNYQGMIYADGEGYYEGTTLILESE